MNNLAKVMRVTRTRRGLSQGELSAQSGVSRQTISSIERGVANPKLATLITLFEALGYTLHINLTEKWEPLMSVYRTGTAGVTGGIWNQKG